MASQTFNFVDDTTVIQPLTGFMSWGGATANSELSNMQFHTLPMSYFYEGNSINFTKFNGLLAGLPAGKYCILRVYTDVPGNESGLPVFLRAGALPYNAFNNQGKSLVPNWTSQSLISELNALWKAIAARYDSDPRLAAVQGFGYGFWAECHYYSLEDSVKSRNTWLPTPASVLALCRTMTTSFVQTPVNIGVALFEEGNRLYNNTTLPDLKKLEFGVFVDVLCHPDANWSYTLFKLRDPAIIARTETLGEVAPAVQSTFLNRPLPVNVYSIESEIKRFNNLQSVISARQFASGFSLTSAQRQQLISDANKMAFKYFISNVRVDDTAKRITVTVGNNGNGAFFRHLTLTSSFGRQLTPVNFGWLLPGQTIDVPFTYTGSLPDTFTLKLSSNKLRSDGAGLVLFNANRAVDGTLTIKTPKPVVIINEDFINKELADKKICRVPDGNYTFSKSLNIINGSKLIFSPGVNISTSITGVFINVAENGQLLANGASITGNQTGTGVQLKSTGYVKNLVVENFETGIHFTQTSMNSFNKLPVAKGCTVRNCTGRGIWTQLVCRAIISDCISDKNGMDGIDIDSKSQGVICVNCKCSDNKRCGIFIEESAQNNTCVNCYTKGNQLGINFNIMDTDTPTENNTVIGHVSEEIDPVRAYRILASPNKATINTMIFDSKGDVYNIQSASCTGNITIDCDIKKYNLQTTGNVLTVLDSTQ